MADHPAFPPLDGAILNRVALVDFITRERTGLFESVSLPGHLIHVITGGMVEQFAAGVRQVLRPGDAVWYYENEQIHGRIVEAPWTFYTVNFHSLTLSPPSFQHRVKTASEGVLDRMKTLLEIWQSTTAQPAIRHIRIHVLLLEILLELLPEANQGFRVDSSAGLWWEIESRVRADLSRPMSMKFLEQLCHRSQQTILRACQLAVGRPPLKRIKEIRLSYARGLVQFSDQTMSEIAYRIGYTRVQEFSRDYHKHFGVTPTEDRQQGPNYQRLETPGEA